MRLLVTVLCALLVSAVSASAQTADVDNPTGVVFAASPDHNAIDGYELEILRPDGSSLQVLNLGKPQPDASLNVTAPLNVQPIAFGTGYSVRVRAKAGSAASAWATSQNKFNRTPAPCGAPVLLQ